jgi:hypothetical protein
LTVSHNEVRKRDIEMIQALRRYFPSTPDWLLGGSFAVLLLWLIVLPAELIEIMIRHEYVPVSFLGWGIKFLYIWGYAISLFAVAPLAEYSSTPDQLGGFLIVLFGLVITSPVYFLIGAFLVGRKESMIALGVALATVHLIASCLVAIWLVRFLFSA